MDASEHEWPLVCSTVHAQYQDLFEKSLEAAVHSDCRITNERFAWQLADALDRQLDSAELIMSHVQAAQSFECFAALCRCRRRQLASGSSHSPTAQDKEEMRAHMWNFRLRQPECEQQPSPPASVAGVAALASPKIKPSPLAERAGTVSHLMPSAGVPRALGHAFAEVPRSSPPDLPAGSFLSEGSLDGISRFLPVRRDVDGGDSDAEAGEGGTAVLPSLRGMRQEPMPWPRVQHGGFAEETFAERDEGYTAAAAEPVVVAVGEAAEAAVEAAGEMAEEAAAEVAAEVAEEEAVEDAVEEAAGATVCDATTPLVEDPNTSRLAAIPRNIEPLPLTQTIAPLPKLPAPTFAKPAAEEDFTQLLGGDLLSAGGLTSERRSWQSNRRPLAPGSEGDEAPLRGEDGPLSPDAFRSNYDERARERRKEAARRAEASAREEEERERRREEIMAWHATRRGAAGDAPEGPDANTCDRGYIEAAAAVSLGAATRTGLADAQPSDQSEVVDEQLIDELLASTQL